MIYPLTFYPGTEDWAKLSQAQGMTVDIFFRNAFRDLATDAGRRSDLMDLIHRMVRDFGCHEGFCYTVEEREAVPAVFPDLHMAHLELAKTYIQAGRTMPNGHSNGRSNQIS